jgi:putative ABC transport system ATP-binding protein
VFEQGSRGELIYVVDSGQVDIYRERADGSEELLNVVGPGEYFGELGPLLGFPRSASARARTEAGLTAYTVRDFRERMGSFRHPSTLLGAAERSAFVP